jgi:hypothetical protein
MHQTTGNHTPELNLLRRAHLLRNALTWSGVVNLLRWAVVEKRDRGEVEALVQRIAKEKHLIFSVSAGRSGTATLFRLFSCLDDIECKHEGPPDFAQFMRLSQSWPRASYHFLVNSKLPAIDASSRPIFMEASHLHCKGLLEPVFELGLRPDLIILRRNPRQIARSLVRIRAVPARTKLGYIYLLHPDDQARLSYPNWRCASDYQLAFWYALEIELRQEFYAQWGRRIGCRVAYANIDDLNELGAIVRLWEALELEPSKRAINRVKKRAGKRFNLRETPDAPDLHSDEELEAAEEAVLKATGLVEARERTVSRQPSFG